jgi:hypothetical protein
MAIAQWSGRRIATLWVIGVVCEVALLIGPPLLVRSYARKKLPELERQIAQMRAEQAPIEERWRLAERADSVAVAAQRREAISAGQYSLTAQGDTVTAVVRAPSGRPDSVDVADTFRTGRYIVFAIVLTLWGSIPIALLAITVVWVSRRRGTHVSAAA